MGQSKTMKEEVEVTQKAFLDLLQHLYVDMEVRFNLDPSSS